MVHESAYKTLHDKFMLNRNPFADWITGGCERDSFEIRYFLDFTCLIVSGVAVLPFPLHAWYHTHCVETATSKNFFKENFTEVIVYLFYKYWVYIFFLYVYLPKNNTYEHFLHSTVNYLKNGIMPRNMKKI